MKKRILSLLLVLCCLITMIGCNKVEPQSSSVVRLKEDLPDGVVIIDPAAVPTTGNLTASSPMCIAILDGINAERAARGLKELVKGGDLAAAAAVRAKEIVNPFSHTRPNGTEWWTVNSSVCYGENLAYGYTSADEVIDAWMNSPAHREVMLADDFISCGIGVFEASDNVLYFSAEFGY